MNTNIKNKSVALTLFSLLTVNAVSALELQLTDEPLFLNQTVPPALAVTFDDSGSMSWAWMPDSRSFDRNRPSFASSDYNLIYYNPNIEYPPPVRSDGTSLPDSNFNNASRDGYYTAGDFLSRRDLRSRYRPFRYYYPNYPNAGSYSISYASAGRSNSENRAFYYTWEGPANATLADKRNQNGNYQRHDVLSTAEKQNFANWYTYYNTRSKLARAAVSHAFVNFGPDFKVDWQQINNVRFRDKATDMDLFADGHREDFYDWLFLVPGNGSTPLRRATMDAGNMFREGGSGGPYYDSNFGGELTCQQNFHIAISDGSWNSSSGRTGNIDNTMRTLPEFPDGTTASYNPANFFYSDGSSSTLADTAFYYWSRDLRTSLDNNVPTFIDDFTDSDGDIVNVPADTNWWNIPELLWNPKNDPANWQHMVNFNIGLGIKGSFDRDTDLPALRAGLLQWPSTFNDTCFRRDSTGVEIVRSCQNHICYEGPHTGTPVIDCSADIADIGLCRNGDNNSTISCSNRIVRRVNREAGRVDDVWHASLNSRGDYFSAQNPQELVDALSELVSSIIKRKGRASAGSISSSIISDATLSFRTGYDTSNWSGFVVASPLNIDGTLGDIEWDAACKLTGGFCSSMNTNVSATNDNDSRQIFTYNYIDKNQHSFKLTDMSSSEVANILDSTFYNNVSGNYTSDLEAANIFIDYVRGDRTKENQFGGDLRNRNNLLGDVIHSPAQILRGPAESYNDDFWGSDSQERIAADNGNGYAEFRDLNRQRDNVILVGANDGMLHAFDAGINTSNGGHELWAYIPSQSLKGISELANPQYKHKSFVDLAPFVQDAFINGGWSTVALGGMRHGGKLVYALDLGSEPSEVPSVLWEFSDKDDADMGFSYSSGVIARVVAPSATANALIEKWVALVPNGYNSSTQKSALYAIDLETGLILHEWNSGIGDNLNPNGMGAPIAADFIAYDETNLETTFFGADQGTDFAYAGDLAGNLYRFDMKDIFGPPVSQPEILFSGDSDQPITTSPRVFTPGDGSSNVVVIFGTGKYIELPDRAILGSQEQYLFGLKDNENTISTFTLNDSRIVEQTITTNGNFRSLSSNDVSSEQSWKIELPELGERLVNTIGRNNRNKIATVATIIPNGEDPCLAGGESWFMIIDSTTGGTPEIGSFFNDGNSDGVFINDLVLGFSSLTVPGGGNSFINIDIAGGDESGDGSITLDPRFTDEWKRRSWHRIMFD